MTDPNVVVDDAIKERFAQLPKVVQDAIISTDLEKRLRDLASTYKLHLDQWDKLENEVMLALLGIQHTEDLEQNIHSHVGVEAAAARTLAQSINQQIFEPIRQELERTLEHPDAQEKGVTDTEAARTQILGTEHAETAQSTPAAPVPPAIQPATPPPPPPDIKITRPSDSTAYKPGEVSSERKGTVSVVDDPYREPIQ